MSSRHLFRFIGGVAAAALVMHVLVTAAAASAIRALYPHRVANARTWPGDGAERFRVVGSFLVENARRHPGSLTAFVGSSVSYGYPWNDRLVFSNLFAERRPATKTINASILATDVTGINDFVLCPAFRNSVRFEFLFIEIPVVNTTAQLLSTLKQRQPAVALGPCAAGGTDADYFQLAAARPRGIGWFFFLWSSEARETEETAMTFGAVPKGYFATASDFDAIRHDYVSQVTTTLKNAQATAAAVYAFPSPIYVGGLREIGEDAGAVQQQLDETERVCRSVPAVRCVETAHLWTHRQYFYNLTHLSQAGHRALAELLDAAVNSADRAARHGTP